MSKKVRIDRKSYIKVSNCNMIKSIQAERFITESEGSVKLSCMEVE